MSELSNRFTDIYVQTGALNDAQRTEIALEQLFAEQAAEVGRLTAVLAETERHLHLQAQLHRVEITASERRRREAEAELYELRGLAQSLWPRTNERRCELIEKSHRQGLDSHEFAELTALQSLADRYVGIMAPLPIEELERYKAELDERLNATEQT